MAKKKQIQLFIDINNQREFDYMLEHNLDRIICVEVFCEFSGPCSALDHLFVRMKLDWSDGQLVLLRVLADEVDALRRFRYQSQPVYLFILNKRITSIFRGVDNIRFAEMAKREIDLYKQYQKGISFERPTYEISEPMPEDLEWLAKYTEDKQLEIQQQEACRAARQAARKRHRAELMIPHLQQLNFVLYWPHAKHAHPELYERWDLNNIIMVGREEINMDRTTAEDILYAGDADINEASMHMLTSSPALAICFRLLDLDKHFVTLVRKILYEDITPSDTKEEQQTAFDKYKSFSPTKEEIWERRLEERQRKQEEAIEKRARRLSEMQRLARQAIQDAIEARRLEKERRKLELLKAGNLLALDKLKQEPDDEKVDIMIPEVLPDEDESVSSEDENEYFPPPGLLIPGFYAPSNDIAKTNGLAILFPKIVREYVIPEPEFLPPHVLVLLDITKRHKAVIILSKYRQAIIHMGIFKLTTAYNAYHIAFSVKQYDSLNSSYDVENVNIAFMISTNNDLALLELMDISPSYVSKDEVVGEEECGAIFPVDYGDNYPEFEDFDVSESIPY
ncbi:unnamed protein product [Pieris macdunnoughi]|uniref:DUF4746 domain-containing protein n=1 Tax=Pieris macdunnoughi TaxID=345717 RepID=A0A821NH38_9NEOP|nr:unnamed protein product [Pieris macdunnoughi]